MKNHFSRTNAESLFDNPTTLDEIRLIFYWPVFHSYEHRMATLLARFSFRSTVSFGHPVRPRRVHFSPLIERKKRKRRKKVEVSFRNFWADNPRTVESFPWLGKTDEYESADGRLFNYKPSSTGVSNFPHRLPSIFEMTGNKWPLTKLLEERRCRCEVNVHRLNEWCVIPICRDFRSASARFVINHCEFLVENWDDEENEWNDLSIFISKIYSFKGYYQAKL